LWIIRGIIIFAGSIGLIWLGTKNAGTKVTFYFFNHTFPEAELNIIIVLSFIAGMIVWAVGAWIREAQLMLRLAGKRREIEKLMEEISELRNIPISEEHENKTGQG
jgi:hypothetical protein